MILKILKLILIYGVLHVALVIVAKPELIKTLEQTKSNQEVERLINARWNATRNWPFTGSSFYKGANMWYDGSQVIGLRERTFLGTYRFHRRYNSATDEIDQNYTIYIPDPFRSAAALIIVAAMYWQLLPALRSRIRSIRKTQ